MARRPRAGNWPRAAAVKPPGWAHRLVLRAKIRQDIEALKTEAGLHAYLGEDTAKLLNSAGRVLFITAFAIGKAKVTDPDVNIILGASSALGDVFSLPASLEQHRPAICAGILAAGRLLPKLTEDDLANGEFRLHALLNSAEGLTLGHITKAINDEMNL